jgi:putative thioredoxin
MDESGAFTKDVDAAEFQQDVLQRSREVPVVVDFWAQWCGPCHVLSPVLERLADEYAGAFELAKIDVDQNQQLSAQFGVQGIPSVIAFRDGAPVSRFTGALPEESVRQWLDSIMPTEVDLMVDQARTARIDGDDAAAEHIFRQVLDRQPDHAEAGTSLASMLIDRGDVDEALIVLGKLTPDSEVDRLQSAARLRASSGDDLSALEARVETDPTDESARIELAVALAGKNEHEPALDLLLAVVREKGPQMEEARLAMVDVFGVLGDEHPLTITYRRQLASALY